MVVLRGEAVRCSPSQYFGRSWSVFATVAVLAVVTVVVTDGVAGQYVAITVVGFPRSYC